MKTPKIEVRSIGAKAKFERWIKNHGGVKVWENLVEGNIYTQAKTRK